MEEAPSASYKRTAAKSISGWHFSDRKKSAPGKKIMIPLSAKSHDCLKATVRNWMNFEEEMEAMAVAGWQATRRDHHSHRYEFMAMALRACFSQDQIAVFELAYFSFYLPF